MRVFFVPRNLALGFTIILLCISVCHVTGFVSSDRIRDMMPYFYFCPFKAVTGIPCPGCGMTRAILSIAKGDVHGAFMYNPFSFLLLFIVIISLIPATLSGRLFANSPTVANSFFCLALAGVLTFWFFARLLPAV